MGPEGIRRFELERAGAVPQLISGSAGGGVSGVAGETTPPASNARARHLRAAIAWERLQEETSIQGVPVWSEWTGAPHRITAAGWRLPGTPSVGTVTEAEAAARDFVLAHRDLLLGGELPSTDELPLVKSRRVGETWFLVFGQRHRSLEVVDGRVDVRLRLDGTIPLVGSQWFSGVDAETSARVHRSAAEAAARAALRGDPYDGRLRGSDLAILPIPAADGPAYRLVHRVRHDSTEPLGVWTSYVDAADGAIWARDNQVRHLDLTGTVTADILPVSPEDAFEAGLLRHSVVRRATDSTLTTLIGDYFLPGVTPGETIQSALRSIYLQVYDAGGHVTLLSATAPALNPLDMHWTFAGGDTSEGNAFYHGLLAHDYIQSIDPAFTDLNYRVPCVVNINSTCNAYWDGIGINFFRYGGGCANTGNVADVVYHEYGHGVTQFTFAPFAPNGAMHEGFSDYLAASMTRQPVIGRGFFGPGSSIRTCDNTRVLPAPECLGAVHCLGTAVSGALWDMQGNLAVALGDSTQAQILADSLWHFAGYGGAYWYDDYLLDLLVVDDDDGTLLNGTPHSTEICDAFTGHGFVCPATTNAAWIVHDPLGDADPGATPYAVLAEIGSFAASLAPGEQFVHFRINEGPWLTSSMRPDVGDLHAGEIPPLTHGGRIDYYLSAEDLSANAATDPPGAPAAYHRFAVGAVSEVFFDDFSGDLGWEPNGDNTATSGYWKRVDPNGTSESGYFFQPEVDHTPNPEVFCYVTGDTTAGLPIGVEDVDNGCVYLVSPRLELAGLTNARLEYWRWFTNETRFDDTLWVEVSDDDGASWTPLEYQVYTQNLWLERSFDLGSAISLTDSVRVRVWTCDLGGGSLTEAALDDVRITTRSYDPVDVEVPLVAELSLAQSEPNPTRGAAVIAFRVPGGSGEQSAVRLRLYDARGRLVRDLVSGPMSPGLYRVAWDGRDDAGRRVPPGAYLYRLEAGGQMLSRKLILTR